MKVSVQPGKYVVAVSGGVDSVALLDMLVQQADLQLVVAHFDHGIRPESVADAQFVKDLAARYGVPYVTERAELGPGASEDAARRARYKFLRRVKREQDAQAIITAHHQDDLLETAIFNLLRGTGRRGLTALRSNSEIVRPLLQIPKADIVAYANQRHLNWQEDSTNHDERYARNYIRHRLLTRFDAESRQRLRAIIEHAHAVNEELDAELLQLTKELCANYGESMSDQHSLKSELSRAAFVQLPHALARELMAAWLRQNGLADYDRKTIERLTVHAKTKSAGKRLDVRRNFCIELTKQSLALRSSER